MIKVILFDCDGLIIKHNKYFSQRLLEQGYKIDNNKVSEFFKGEFLECEVGKKDLKQILPKWLPLWGYSRGVDELLKFWFEGEAEVDLQMRDYILGLKKRGISCHLSTNNEKYRTGYLANVVGLQNIFEIIFSSYSLGFMKPQIGYWEEINKSLAGVKKEEVLVWDDVESAIHSAKEFGFNAEFYSDYKDFKDKMENKYLLK